MAGVDRSVSHMPSPCSSPASAHTSTFSEFLKRDIHQTVYKRAYDACYDKLKEVEASITASYNDFVAGQERARQEEQRTCRARFSTDQDSVFQGLLGADLPEETVTTIMAELSSRFASAPWSVEPRVHTEATNVASQTPSTPPPEVDPYEGPSATASATEAAALNEEVETPSTPSPPKRPQSPDLSTVETPSNKRPRTTQASGQSFELVGTMTRYRQAPANRRNTSHQTVEMHEVEGLDYVVSYANKWLVFKCGCRNKHFLRDPLHSGWGILAHLKKKRAHRLNRDMSDQELVRRYGFEVLDADAAWAMRSNERLKDNRAREAEQQILKRRVGKIFTPVRRRPERLRATSSETLRAPTCVPEARMSVSEGIPSEPPSASRSAIIISDTREDSDDELPPISSVGRK